MTCSRLIFGVWIAVGFASMSVIAGCDSTGHAQFTPKGDEARVALEAALGAWQSGKPYGQVDANPAVRVADSVWQSGGELERFEIGNEEDPGDGTKQFDVTLVLKKSKEARHLRYVVNGRDPAWVFNGEDYKKTINMDNGPEPAGATGKRRSPKKR